MRRTHLFEFEDFDWVPRAVRDGGTDLLDLGFAVVRFYRPLVPVLLDVLEATGSRAVVDVCSGGGGGALAMRAAMRAQGRGGDVQWTLCDRFPNAGAMARVRALGDPAVRYLPDPVDALIAQPELPGVRTMFGALHHFQPDQVRALLAATVASRAPLAFFDIAASPALRRMPAALAPVAMASNMALLFGLSFVLVPFARPFRWSRLLATYALPLVPALVAWDGTVSALRAYEPGELLEIARSVPGAEGYRWAADRAGGALYITGIPR